MKFDEFKYSHIDINTYEKSFRTLIEKLRGSTSFAEAMDYMNSINELRIQFETMMSLGAIRHHQNTEDQKYAAEQEYIDSVSPHYEKLEHEFYKALELSEYKNELVHVFGKHLFNFIVTISKAFHEDNITLQQEENKLTTEYDALVASMKFNFQGKSCTLSEIEAYFESDDRSTRKKACETKWAVFEENKTTLDTIYDLLVNIRTRKAQTMGYENFIDMGYYALGRYDYTDKDVEKFRQYIRQYVVPLSEMLIEKQRKRIGLDKLKYYDLNYHFKTGNPKLHGDCEMVMNAAGKMYKMLSTEASSFYGNLRDNELLDLVSRPNKSQVGYCEFVCGYQASFIFGHYNGTFEDILLLTHEFGHAFQVHCSRNQKIVDYYWPTCEACEIHSTSMEYFTFPWMDLFFGNDAEKYKYLRIVNALTFLPRAALVDEFQHEIYAQPKCSKEQRHTIWKDLRSIYLPSVDYDGQGFLENGGTWMDIPHIYENPFYYIDYALAEICALQYWMRFENDRAETWECYVNLCKTGGSESFLSLLKQADLDSPFDEKCFCSVINHIQKHLEKIDDTHF